MGRLGAQRARLKDHLSDALRESDAAGLLLVGAHVAAALAVLGSDRPVRRPDALLDLRDPLDPLDVSDHVADGAVADRGHLQDGPAGVLLVAEAHGKSVAHQDGDPA